MCWWIPQSFFFCLFGFSRSILKSPQMKKVPSDLFLKTFPPSSPWKFQYQTLLPCTCNQFLYFCFFPMEISIFTLFNKSSTTAALPTLPLIGWCLLPLVGLVAFYAFTSTLLFSVFDVNPNLKMQHVCVGGWHQVDIGISHQHHFHFPPEFQPVFNVGGWYKAGDALWHQSIIQHVSDVSLDVKPTFGFDMNQIFIYD